MRDILDLLSLTRDIAHSAGRMLCDTRDKAILSHSYLEDLPREMKAIADQVLEKEILRRLEPVGLPILSEEFGEVAGSVESELRFIVDPIDGTVNFVRGLGPASISIALYRDSEPVFGVLAIYPTGNLAWGGKDLGACLNDSPIKVSAITDPMQGVLCTGIPSRFQFNDQESSVWLTRTMSSYGKIRMLGAASISLLHVAQGAAEVYSERDIMLWDVAAGLAIVEGAGGALSVEPCQDSNALNVVASNGVINFS